MSPIKCFLSEEEILFRQTVMDFSKRTIAPRVREFEKNQSISRDLIQELFQQGLMAIEVDERWGGGGASFFHCILAIEALAMWDPSVSVFVDVQNTLFIDPIKRYASQDIQETILPAAAREKVGCYALTEPQSGSDAFALRTRAEKKGDFYYLTGQKVFITNSGEADYFLIFANLNPEMGYRGITCFLGEKGQKGLSLGKKEDKLGIRASSTCEVLLNQCEIHASRRVGEEGEGYKIAIETLNGGRVGIAAQMLGLAQGAFNLAREYANERVQFKKRIREFQAVQFDFARHATLIEAARGLVYQAARARDAQQSIVQLGAMAKLFAGEVAEKTSSWAIEVFGGYGYTTDFLVEKFYRDAKIGSIYEGTSNMQLQTISKSIWESDK